MDTVTGDFVVYSTVMGTDLLRNVELFQTTAGTPLLIATRLALPAPDFTGLTPGLGFTAGADYLTGGMGADFLGGGDGSDSLYGGPGGDSIAGGNNGDALFGGKGNDMLLSQQGADSLYGGIGGDYMHGGAGNDELEGDPLGYAGNDTLLGGVGDDYVRGGSGNDVLDGGGENDTLFGDFGTDIVMGGAGNDVLYGDLYVNRHIVLAVPPTVTIDSLTVPGTIEIVPLVNDDQLVGGDGDDTLADLLYGGGGADRFVFTSIQDSTLAAPDIIFDFGGSRMASHAGNTLPYSRNSVFNDRDYIDLSEIDADLTKADNNAFTYIGTAGFSGTGQLRIVTTATGTLIEGNINADLAADFRIDVRTPTYSFSEVDFVL
jgi:Ca2+-binding RTX toxin-like protein